MSLHRGRDMTFPNGVRLIKWGLRSGPTAEGVAEEAKRLGYIVYDLQTIPPWFERSRHSHDEPEVRVAVSGRTTFHFDDLPITIEAGDILCIPGGLPHEVISHNGDPFSAYKGSISGARRVTEHERDGRRLCPARLGEKNPTADRQ